MRDDIVCERTYQFLLDGEPLSLPVRWLKPVSDRGDWSCEFQIEWPDRPTRSMTIFGVDSVQALYLAMQAVAAELYTHKPPIFWFEPDDILGLPTSGTTSDFEAARSKGRA